jgi:hypothetical protein
MFSTPVVTQVASPFTATSSIHQPMPPNVSGRDRKRNAIWTGPLVPLMGTFTWANAAWVPLQRSVNG